MYRKPEKARTRNGIARLGRFGGYPVARRLARVLRSVVQSFVLAMLNAGHKLPLGRPVAAKFVGFDDGHTIRQLRSVSERTPQSVSLADASLRLLAEAWCRIVSDGRIAMVIGTLRW
jgi:hypothetical protein